MRIAICAPARPIMREDAARVAALAAVHQPGIELAFHEQCFASTGHFAGDDATRLGAFRDCAGDPGSDAVWFARGGYGACRIAEAAMRGLGAAARDKRYLGYSDMGYLLAGLYRHRIGRPAHGPLVNDITRAGGDAAVIRALGWFGGHQGGLEGGPEGGLDGAPAVAFNLTTLAMVSGTPLMPDLSGHVVLVEEIGEYLYAVDRLFFHLARHLRGIAGLRLGRVSNVSVNDVEFGKDAMGIARDWCARAGVKFLGDADIGHDVGNHIVPFGHRT